MSTEELAKALYTINRHAKTAPEPQHLYYLKKSAIEKLLKENKAKKIGLHFSENPKMSSQHSTLLIKVAQYYFHIPPTKEDFKKLKHLGEQDQNYRNPQTKMPLSEAKRIISKYIGLQPKRNDASVQTSTYSSYTPSSLGKLDWRNGTPNYRTKR
ncbi:YkyB family protein [Aciduricibacillus chroicocephali]|uniref:YkyB family protein n=1 Tax=Aciduricibacillus chroicocephali TaxID=3054939 RepID=A0ABY9KYM1_9BACI|nr:YkyB family protein [Bacillaceae bacterium 44XB]